MVTARPVDLFTPPAGFAMSRVDGIRTGRCARCAVVVTTDPALHEDDLREWEISALCPACFDYATAEKGTDCHE